MSRRTAAVLLASVAVALPLTACGGEDPVAEVEDIPAGTTYVELDSGFVKALESLDLEPAPVGAADIRGGSARFPITGGDVKVYEPGTEDPYVQGEIKHDGSGLSLASEDTTVALTNFVVDPGESVLKATVRVDGKVAEDSVDLFFLDGSTLDPLRADDDSAVLEGTTVKLTDGAADLLNETFGTDAVEGGLEIGIAKIVVQSRVS